MKERKKLVSYFFVLLFIAIIFVIAWLIARSRVSFLNNLPFTGTESPTITVTPVE